MLNVEDQTHVRRIQTEPEFLKDLRRILEPETADMEELVKLFFVVVSETLITGSLKRLPEDVSVQGAVRSLADAHAKDEGQHHAYFKSLFENLWPSLPRQLQTKVGVLLPSMLRAFLSPDRTYLTAVLRQYPQLVANPDALVDRLIDSESTTAGMLDAASKSMLMFRKTGVFDDSVIRAAFHENAFDTEVS